MQALLDTIDKLKLCLVMAGLLLSIKGRRAVERRANCAWRASFRGTSATLGQDWCGG
jgi:hypothetical protein